MCPSIDQSTMAMSRTWPASPPCWASRPKGRVRRSPLESTGPAVTPMQRARIRATSENRSLLLSQGHFLLLIVAFPPAWAASTHLLLPAGKRYMCTPGTKPALASQLTYKFFCRTVHHGEGGGTLRYQAGLRCGHLGRQRTHQELWESLQS